ncbi:hypothetical protein LOK49_LG01G02616 [Camellia lanceoleosa]|uniref:Uncharacterized protein n=1 Tax=Camellia lanceoleosa TaxID=1840588 RepID=A0ACC0J6G0_9ERIC|nr:hypothetical protein LOK49_LG01G02616 [Camellia lanceoleosa]
MPDETHSSMELEEKFEFSSDSNELGASKMANMNFTNINPMGSGSKQKHSLAKTLQNKRITGAVALATSMDDLVNFVQTQSKELTVNHVVGGHSYTMGQAVGWLTAEYRYVDMADWDDLATLDDVMMPGDDDVEMTQLRASVPLMLQGLDAKFTMRSSASLGDLANSGMNLLNHISIDTVRDFNLNGGERG